MCINFTYNNKSNAVLLKYIVLPRTIIVNFFMRVCFLVILSYENLRVIMQNIF